jgi:ketopantoate reductase
MAPGSFPHRYAACTGDHDFLHRARHGGGNFQYLFQPKQMSSNAQDLARGKLSEIDFLNGYVVRKGAELGIPTPTNHALQVMVKLVEVKRKQ